MRRLLRTTLAIVVAVSLAGDGRAAGGITLLGAGKQSSGGGGGGGGGVNFRKTPADTTANITRNSALTGTSNPTTWWFFANIDTQGATSGGYYLASGAGGLIQMRLVGGGANVRFVIGGSGQIETEVTGLTSGQENRITAVFDSTKPTCGTAGAVTIYINDTSVGPGTCAAWQQNFAPDMSTDATWEINQAQSGQGVGGAGGAYWYIGFDYGGHCGTYLDFSQQVNRDQLKLGTLLADASNACGGAPYVFFGGTALSDWTTPVAHGSVTTSWTSGSTWSELLNRRIRFARDAANNNRFVPFKIAQ